MPRPLRCEGGARFYGEDGGMGDEEETGGYVTFFSEESNKEPVL